MFLIFTFSIKCNPFLSLFLSLNAWFDSMCEHVCVDHFYLCKRCMYMIPVLELHEGCFLWGNPVNWGKPLQCTRLHSNIASRQNSKLSKIWDSNEVQPGACRQKRLNFIRLISGVDNRIFLRKVWKGSCLKTWQFKRIEKIADEELNNNI